LPGANSSDSLSSLGAPSAGLLEDVVLGNRSPGRQLASGGGDRLHRATQLHLLLEQPDAGGSVLRRFSGKSKAHGVVLSSIAKVFRRHRRTHATLGIAEVVDPHPVRLQGRPVISLELTPLERRASTMSTRSS
jgi:hypothetical protein